MKKIDKIKITYFTLGGLIVLLFLFFSYSRVFDEFEYSTIDLRYRLRPPQPVRNEIVIIEIGDDSIEKLGKWPFPRKYHALLIKALDSAGVDTIVFDMFFSEDKPGDEELADAVKESGKVYVPYVFDLNRDNPHVKYVNSSGYAAPLIDVIKQNVKGSGFVNVEPDIDGKIRRVPPFIEYEGKFYPHLSVEVALNRKGYDFEHVIVNPEKNIVVDDGFVIPLATRSSFLVNYPGVWGKAFRHYSYVDILQSYLASVTGQEPVVDLKELKGAVCFIGLTATASPDAHPSPMEPLYPGIGVHTSVYNSIMNLSYIDRLGRLWNLLILVIMWGITIYVTERSRKRFALLSILLIMVGYTLVAMLFFWPFGLWIDVFYPLVTIAVTYVVFTFKKYVTETQKREILEKELNIAKDIQQSFLPKELPEVGGIEIYAHMLTARQVGGDLYDVVQLDDNRIGIMLGDVSGKGVPAALYMAKAVSVFRTYVHEGNAQEVVEKVNNRLVSEGSSNLFVTLTYMIFDTKTNTTTYSIGGHMPTVLIEPDGEVLLLDLEEGMPLGMIECEFSIGERKYKPGSIFVLYTDGVTEAMNLQNDMFGQERLVDLAKKLKGKSPEEVVKAIHDAVTVFAGKAKQHDDITVMAIKT